MKKLTLFLIFFLVFILPIPKNMSSKEVMLYSENTHHYDLIFKDEILNIRNFKLKMGLLTSYDYNITKVYFKNVKDIKEYFSFDNSNFNVGIEKLKSEYVDFLKEKNMYDVLDKDIDETIIERIELYVGEDALTKLKGKYPKIIIQKLK